MSKEVDSNSFELVRDNPLSAEGVYMYSGRMIGLPNLDPDKLYPVYRPAEELEKAAESFNNVPFIIGHEMIGEGATPYDQRPASGVLTNVKYKAGKLYGDLKIWSEKMKDKILSGVKELSLGYKSIYERSRGVFNGQTYDFVQRNLRGNHLALVKNGRMGSEMRVYDAKEAMTFDSIEFNINNKTIEKGTSEMAGKTDNEPQKEEVKTSDEFVSVEKLYAKFPEAKEWIDANKYKRSPEKSDDAEEKEGEKEGEGEKGEDGVIVEKTDSSKTGFVTRKSNDGEGGEGKVDKRKLIDEVGGILKGKVDDEIIRTVMKKMEEASYNKSESGEADDGEEKDGGKEGKEGKEGEGEGKGKDGCGMDAAEIRKEAIANVRKMDSFYKKILPFTGAFTYDSMESLEEIAEEACKKLKLESNGNAFATVEGFIAAKGKAQVHYTLDANESKPKGKDEVKSRLEALLS